jgi:hypothetical protein
MNRLDDEVAVSVKLVRRACNSCSFKIIEDEDEDEDEDDETVDTEGVVTGVTRLSCGATGMTTRLNGCEEDDDEGCDALSVGEALTGGC